MLHLETDLYKQYLTFYTDQNFFSDRTNGWIELSEWDATYALTGVEDDKDRTCAETFVDLFTHGVHEPTIESNSSILVLTVYHRCHEQRWFFSKKVFSRGKRERSECSPCQGVGLACSDASLPLLK
jgi:hypothetical protein